jgi:carbonic anhydrase
LNNYIFGYIGTQTVPNCERGVCWYIIKDPLTISPNQFNALKVKDITANRRGTQPILKAYKQYDAPGIIY